MIHSEITRYLAGFAATSLLSFSVLTASSSNARAQNIGDAMAGRRLAETWCSNCHAVTPKDRQAAGSDAPTFAAIALTKATTPLSLRAFLQTPHSGMPDLHLTQNEVDDIAEYILSLRRP